MSNLGPDREYTNWLAQGRLMLQRCRDSGRYVFYPRVAEPRSGSTNLEWVEASGRGCVYATTVVRRKPPTQDYNVALIDLEEGVRMMSRVEGVAPEDVKIGMQVTAKIIEDHGARVVVFVSAEPRH
jgi:uncharacterized OB-fold protein